MPEFDGRTSSSRAYSMDQSIDFPQPALLAFSRKDVAEFFFAWVPFIQAEYGCSIGYPCGPLDIRGRFAHQSRTLGSAAVGIFI
jgi:hypothetical protein